MVYGSTERSGNRSLMPADGGARTAAGPGGWSYTMSSLSRTAATIARTILKRFAGGAISASTSAALGRTGPHGEPRSRAALPSKTIPLTTPYVGYV